MGRSGKRSPSDQRSGRGSVESADSQAINAQHGLSGRFDSGEASVHTADALRYAMSLQVAYLPQRAGREPIDSGTSRRSLRPCAIAPRIHKHSQLRSPCFGVGLGRNCNGACARTPSPGVRAFPGIPLTR